MASGDLTPNVASGDLTPSPGARIAGVLRCQKGTPVPELREPPVPGKWETGLLDADVPQRLANKQARRPAALHPYGTGASRRWLLSWVKNTGADFQDWGWTQGMSPADLGQEVDGAHDRLRLFLIEPIPGVNQLAAVWFIRDMSSNAVWLTWDWRPEIPSNDLKNTVPAGHRLTCVRALNAGASKVAAIWTQDDSGAPWDWSPSLTFDELHVILRDSGSRLVSLDHHGSGSSLRFCAAWVANVGPGAEPRTWFWFAGADEPYLRGQSEGLCSHPVELANLGGGALATILNRTPAPGVPPDDALLDVSGMETLDPFVNDEATNTQMNQNGTVNVQVTNIAGAPVEIVSAALRWASLGGQTDALSPSPPDPVAGATTIPTSGSVSPSPISMGTGVEYRDVLAFIDAKTADGRRQRLIRALPVQRPGFDVHVVPAFGEPVGLAMWTDSADVIPMWRGGKETRWVNVAGTIVNLTGDDLSIIRMDVEVVADGEWLLEKNVPLRFQQSAWPDEQGCADLNNQPGCYVVEAEPDGTLELGAKVLSRFVNGFELDIDPQFTKGNLRLVLHYQRKRRCGTVMRDLPLRWDEPVDASPPVRGTFWWGNSYDHTDFDAHAWPGPRAAFDIAEDGGPADGGQDVYPMADGTVVQVDQPPSTPSDPNPNQSITLWHPQLGMWTGYYHLQPGSLLPSAGDPAFANTAIAKVGKSGTGSPHLHTGGLVLATTGFGRVVPLRFTGLTDDQDNIATQTPATGSYKS